MNKKGFSLVELIIVIAIMAILVGFIAPQMIKYIERTNISSDVQLADTVRSCLLVSITDAKIVEDPASQPYLQDMEDGNGMSITNASWDGSSILEESLKDAVGLTNLSDLLLQVRSKNDSSALDIKAYTDNNKVKVVIEGTDETGKGQFTQANWITVD